MNNNFEILDMLSLPQDKAENDSFNQVRQDSFATPTTFIGQQDSSIGPPPTDANIQPVLPFLDKSATVTPTVQIEPSPAVTKPWRASPYLDGVTPVPTIEIVEPASQQTPVAPDDPNRNGSQNNQPLWQAPENGLTWDSPGPNEAATITQAQIDAELRTVYDSNLGINTAAGAVGGAIGKTVPSFLWATYSYLRGLTTPSAEGAVLATESLLPKVTGKGLLSSAGKGMGTIGGGLREGAAYAILDTVANGYFDRSPHEGSWLFGSLAVPLAFAGSGSWKSKSAYAIAGLAASAILDRVLPANDHQEASQLFQTTGKEAFYMGMAGALPLPAKYKTAAVVGTWSFHRFVNMDDLSSGLLTLGAAGANNGHFANS